MPKSEPSSFHVRLSPALMKRIRLAAVENGRSVNAEIFARLEGSFEMNDPARQQIKALLSRAIEIVDAGEKS